jgi:hypothetical protein
MLAKVDGPTGIRGVFAGWGISAEQVPYNVNDIQARRLPSAAIEAASLHARLYRLLRQGAVLESKKSSPLKPDGPAVRRLMW